MGEGDGVWGMVDDGVKKIVIDTGGFMVSFNVSSVFWLVCVCVCVCVAMFIKKR